MRFNSVIAAFLFILMTTLVALGVFVQTESFARLVTKVVTDISERRAGVELSLGQMEISLFPPGVEFNKVSVLKKINDEEYIWAEMGLIGIYLSLIEIEERKISLGELKVSHAVLDIKLKEGKEAKATKEEIPEEVIENVFKTVENLPFHVDTLLLENTLINYNDREINLKRFKVFEQDGKLTSRFHVSNLSIINEIAIDEIWGDLHVDRKNVSIQRLKIQHDIHQMLLRGEVLNYRKLSTAKVSLKGDSKIYLNATHRQFELPDFIKINGGVASTLFGIEYEKDNYSVSSELFIERLNSNLLEVDELRAGLSFKNGVLDVNHFSVKEDKGSVELIRPVTLFSLPTAQFLNEDIELDANNFRLNDALNYLDFLDVLDGRLVGKLVVKRSGKNVYFVPEDSFVIRDLALQVGDKDFEILRIEEAQLFKSEFSIIDREFQMKADVDLLNSRFSVVGYASSKDLRFQVKNGRLNLTDLGNIAKTELTGTGDLDLEVYGPPKRTRIDFKGKFSNFGILGYQLGESDIDVSIPISEGMVVINKVDALVGVTQIHGSGSVSWKNSDIAIGIDSPMAHHNDVIKILNPIFSKLSFLPKDLDFKTRIDAYIYGQIKLEDLKVKANLSAEDVLAYSEVFSEAEMELLFKDRELSFNKVKLKKENSYISGDFSYDLKNDYLKVGFFWDNLLLSSFTHARRLGVNVDGLMSGSLNGQGSKLDFSIDLKNLLRQTVYQNYRYHDSFIDLNIRPFELSGSLNVFGKSLVSNFKYAFSPMENSFINLKIDIDDIKPHWIALLGYHIDSENLTGKVKFDGSSSFTSDLHNFDLVANFKEISFNHPGFNFHYENEYPEYVIENNKISHWSFNVETSDVKLKNRGVGEFGKKVEIEQELVVNAKVLEILFSKILSSEGDFELTSKISGLKDNYQFVMNAKSDGISLGVENLPTNINNLKFDLSLIDRKLIVHNLVSSLDSGKVSFLGDIYFDGDEPDVNFKYVIDRAEIPILGKSVINVSGEGIVLGNNYPYNISGDLIVNKAHIVNELGDFTGKSASVSQIRYLPEDQDSILGKLFNLGVNVKAENPVTVNNSMLDVALRGQVRLIGNPLRPKAEGRLYAPANSSRIFFKNNEYTIVGADFNFSPKKEITNPDFDVQATTSISNFNIQAKAYGDLERFNFDLTSDPPLTRNSIFSLIAFGYTDEIQRTLDPREQQNLTSVGVGSFVFDRFKVADILNKQFGLQINLGTVFEQSQTTSMLTGRSQDGQGTLGRTRSATKIELKKRLDDAMTLSVSSTMGGSIGQRQSMNLTYNLNKKMQLEGVYELRTNEEGLEDVIDNSIGGDLKVRWTFK
ncbi:MAG TPA: translocation/assembly module TamB domain-containing protein [Bacteriovoracaceae bacterium]|nr:translocation/assembly module TamB domain-containing protein [Bacteriovoracaceae bacterium]